MDSLDALKREWASLPQSSVGISEPGMLKIARERVRKHLNVTMKFFWASFTLQLVVYALCSHVIVKYWGDMNVAVPALACIVIFIPFTVLLMRRFKTMAFMRAGSTGMSDMQQYVIRQRELINNFYRFKRVYELIQVPLSAAIGVFLVFYLYVPGGVVGNPNGAWITYVVTIVSCAFAIIRENRIHFKLPLDALDAVIEEFRNVGQD